MSQKRKFYQVSKMMRAGRTLSLVRCPITAFQIGDDWIFRPVATCEVIAITRDGVGFPKEFARATAGIPLESLSLYTCSAEDAKAMAAQVNGNERNKAVKELAHR